MKFSIKDFFSKFDQIHSFQRICSYLLKKSVMENLIFCAVIETWFLRGMFLEAVPKLLYKNAGRPANLWKNNPVQMFSFKFCKLSHGNFFVEHLWTNKIFLKHVPFKKQPLHIFVTYNNKKRYCCIDHEF